jgi:two-component system sensor histidine kinase QseC
MTDTHWFSLRRRLLILLFGGVAVCWTATLVWSYFDAHHEIDELFDAQLAQTAQALLAQRHQLRRPGDDDEEDDRDGDHRPSIAHPYQSRVIFQIWQADQLLLRSPQAPTTPLVATDGFSESNDGHGRWRYYSQWDAEHHHRVQVAEDQHDRHQLIAKIVLRLALPALVILPLLGAWVWLAIRRGLQPLDAVAAEIATRAPDRLTPLSPARAPTEIRPLAEALNTLFARVEEAIANERRFTADAAHELRTPLAALAAQAQVAVQARNDEERRHAMAQLATSLRRTTRLVDQMLTLARLDHDGAPKATQVRLDVLAEEICAFYGPLAIEKQIGLELVAKPVSIGGDADMLSVLLRNLVDNALRYTPSGGQVIVEVDDDGLSVEDSGPGIPAEERARIFDRFYRLAGQDCEGSGLGLSIVLRIAERHGAQVLLATGDSGSGLKVSLRLAASAPPGSDDAS